MLEIKKFEAGPLKACCYIISSGALPEAIIIDPGGDTEEIINCLKENNLKPIYIINTHGHGDHIGGNKELKEKYPDIQICIHNDDAEMLTDPFKNLSLLGGKRYSSPPADKIFNHGDKIEFADYTFKILHLPGHTRGGIGIFTDAGCNGGQPILFSGDTLLAGGIGGTNFPGGDHEVLVQSIKKNIFTLNENAILHPGHGPSSTIKIEKERFGY